ncbi:MAG: hypothetical protein WCF23_16830 [Candidatus Nitrosopolaris sp.]
MPKRKVKEEKAPKRLGKKEVLIPPIAMGASLLVALVILPHFAPPPIPTKICLRSQNADQFNLYPRVQVIVDGKQNSLPAGVGNSTVNGKECLHVIHTDAAGSTVHIEYIRPIRLTMADFMKIYSPDNKTISVLDNSSGIPHIKTLSLEKYNIHYSYYSEKGEFTKVNKPSDFPPFVNNMVARLELTSTSQSSK